ncbi:MAG: hypothetical protein KGI27_10160 [Thaumarchaeota archaeon]|nr:hypothetical protein [Nitrososphaerota archaeon]
MNSASRNAKMLTPITAELILPIGVGPGIMTTHRPIKFLSDLTGIVFG